MSESQKLPTVMLTGRCEDINVHKGDYFHKITLPAVDAYTRPAIVEVRSDKRLSNPGDEVSVRATIGGWIKRYDFTDKSTGESKQISQSVMTLTAV